MKVSVLNHPKFTYTFLFGVWILATISSCKKKDSVVPPIELASHLHHSGLADLTSFYLDTNQLDPSIFQIQIQEDSYTRYYDIDCWISGKKFGENVGSGEQRTLLTINFEFPLNANEFQTSCGCYTPITANRIAELVNNNDLWNQSGSKDIGIVVYDGQNSGGGLYTQVQPKIHAQALGSSIRLYASIDSLNLGDSYDKWVTNLNFDYTFPANP